MNAKEFRDYMLTHMTAEEALLKLLEGPLIAYEKLKFDKGEEVHPIMVITMAAMDLGWNLAIPDDEDGDTEIIGMVVGTEEYLDGIFDGKYRNFPDDNPPDHYDADEN